MVAAKNENPELLAARLAGLADLLGDIAPIEAARAVLIYQSGVSAQLAARETGLPIRRINAWVDALGVKRSAAETEALKRAALAAVVGVGPAIRRSSARWKLGS